MKRLFLLCPLFVLALVVLGAGAGCAKSGHMASRTGETVAQRRARPSAPLPRVEVDTDGPYEEAAEEIAQHFGGMAGSGMGMLGAGMMGAPEGEPFGAAPAADASLDRKLIRTATLTLADLEDAEATLKKIEVIAREAGGFVSDSSITRSYDEHLDGSVTLRVPSEKFGTVLPEIRALGKVEGATTNVADVTDQYVDLEARIRNAIREEEEIRKLLDRSGKLSDIIEIESKLSEVRERIERFQGQMRVLQDQVGLSTITVMLQEKRDAPVPKTAVADYDVGRDVRGAYRTLIRFGQTLLSVLVWMGVFGWVFWVPLVLAIVVYRKRKANAPPAAADPPPRPGDAGWAQPPPEEPYDDSPG